MPEQDQHEPLTVLLDRTGAQVRQIPILADRLLAHSANQLLVQNAGLPYSLVLPKVACNWHLYFRKSGKRVFLLFFRRNTAVRTLMRTKISMDLVPAEEPEPRFGETKFRLVLPEFIVRNPPDLSRYTHRKVGNGPAVMFRFGDDVLTVGTKSRRNPKLAFTPAGGDRVDMDDHTGYLLWPMTLFLNAVQNWMKAKASSEDGVEIDMTRTAKEPEPLTLLDWIGRTYHKVNTALKDETDRLKFAPALNELQTDFRATNFHSEIMLRLNPDAQLAEKANEEQFSLLLRIRASKVDTLSAHVAPPDFLIAGDLRQAFLDSLLANDCIQRLSKQLKWPSLEVRNFLDQTEDSFTFRISARPKNDINIVIVRGHRAGKPCSLVIKGEFEVKDQDDTPTVIADAGKLKVLFQGTVERDTRIEDDDMMAYFVKFARVFRKWLGVLPNQNT